MRKNNFVFLSDILMKKCYFLLLVLCLVGQVQAQDCCYRQTESYYDQNPGYYIPEPQYYDRNSGSPTPTPEYYVQNPQYYPQAPEYCPEYCDTQLPEYCTVKKCRPYYVGIDAGWCFGLSDSSSQRNGGDFTGVSSDAHSQSGSTMSVAVGRSLNKFLRADIQYTFLSTPYAWDTNFGDGTIEPFTARLHAHLLLANVYLHLNPFFRCKYFDSYVAGGVGAAFNSFKDILERSSLNSHNIFSRVESHSHNNFAGRVGIGIMRSLGNCGIVNLEFNSYYVGTFLSGSRRDFPDGGSEIIGPYKFNNNWLGSLSLGFKFIF